jgi:hypothetical protein
MLYFNRQPRREPSACLQSIQSDREAGRAEQQRQLLEVINPYLRELAHYEGGAETAMRLQMEALASLRSPGQWAGVVAERVVDEIHQHQLVGQANAVRAESLEHTNSRLRQDAIRTGRMSATDAKNLGYHADLAAVQQQRQQAKG